MIWKINLSTRAEDKKEKEAGSGGWRVKEGSESTLGCEGSPQRGCEQIWGWGGAQADLERLLHTGCRGHREIHKGFRTSKEARRADQNKNEGSEGRDRAGGA